MNYISNHNGLVNATNRAGWSFILACVVIAVLFSYFPPYWMTNDDVGMAMRAHGFGNTEEASPYIQWGNFVWGYIVHRIPFVFGVPGYSIATVTILLFVLCALFYFGFELTRGKPQEMLLVLLSTLLVMVTPVVFPQFTINAGLLSIVTSVPTLPI